jgi:hypothetical protein
VDVMGSSLGWLECRSRVLRSEEAGGAQASLRRRRRRSWDFMTGPR